MSVVLFHRNFKRLQGGHLKVFHYFESVRSSTRHEALIRFTADSLWDESNPWFGLRDDVVPPDAEVDADVLFLAGADWRWLTPEQQRSSQLPIINYIQYLARPGDDGPWNRFLPNPAIRICVSLQVQEQLEGAVPGPVFTIPVGIDVNQLPEPLSREERDIDCVIAAIKVPPLGRQVAARLRKAGYRVVLVDEPLPRSEYLNAMRRARVAVHLPLSVEGSPLPPLESMSLGVAVVSTDCVGNRSYCRDGETCVVPAREERAIAEAAIALLRADEHELKPMLDAALAESASRTLSEERRQFLEVLDRAGELWRER